MDELKTRKHQYFQMLVYLTVDNRVIIQGSFRILQANSTEEQRVFLLLQSRAVKIG